MKKFKEVRLRLVDDLRSGRPPTSQMDGNVIGVRDVLNSDRRMSVCPVNAATYYVDVLER